MKKTTIYLLGIAMMAFMGTQNANAQAVEKGTIIIDPYYGFPSTGRNFLKEAYGASDVKITGLGPTGGRVEYMLADRFGIGVDFIYKQLKGDFTEVDSSIGTEYDYTASITRIRIHMRFNYHLMASSEDLDLYFGMGVGTNNRVLALDSPNDPDVADYKIDNVVLFPFSIRAAFGMRYYFTENIGINSEIGIGGPLVSVGLSLKF